MGQLFSDVEPDTRKTQDDFRYRRMSPFAVASLVGGVIAFLGLAVVQDLGPIPYSIIPVFGIVSGLRGLSAVRRYDEIGKTPARVGLVLSLICLASAWPLKSYLDANELPEGYERLKYEVLQSRVDGPPVPESAKAFDGKRVFVKGFVYPGRETTGIKQFVLCRDNGACCFGGKPKLNDMIQVTLKEPLTLDYDTRMRGVGGVFRVKEESASDGLGVVLYQLEADQLR